MLFIGFNILQRRSRVAHCVMMMLLTGFLFQLSLWQYFVSVVFFVLIYC